MIWGNAFRGNISFAIDSKFAVVMITRFIILLFMIDGNVEDISSKEDMYYDIIQNMMPRKVWDLILIEETAREIINPDWFLIGLIEEAKSRQEVDWSNRSDKLYWREIEQELLQIEHRIKSKTDPAKPPSLMSRARELRDEAINEKYTEDNCLYYQARFEYLFRNSDQMGSYLSKIKDELSGSARRNLKNTAMDFRNHPKNKAKPGRPPTKK